MLISGQAAALVSGNGRQECHLSELLPAASGGVWGWGKILAKQQEHPRVTGCEGSPHGVQMGWVLSEVPSPIQTETWRN